MDLAPLFLDNCSYPHFWSRQSYILVYVMDIYRSQKQIEMLESMKKSGGNKLQKILRYSKCSDGICKATH
ncbi:unnamed protein product [Prunus armeniaca]|uniref:Uncharacterized protein n=1 Tax=Prunus armeniaca TaxID=36596 RepID=A0A6J5VKS8_PRUAR|nr:unnamed protein product [Prunus armeniaca]